MRRCRNRAIEMTFEWTFTDGRSGEPMVGRGQVVIRPGDAIEFKDQGDFAMTITTRQADR